jgi:hypothetical protein
MADKPPKFKVLRDSREQKGKGWRFNASDHCEGMEVVALPTGDYTLAGYEEQFVIERKGSVIELAGNLFEPRFVGPGGVLERLGQMTYPFIIVEANYSEVVSFPRGARLTAEQKKKLRISSSLLMRRIWEMQLTHGVPILFLGKFAQPAVLSLFKRISQLCQPTKATWSTSEGASTTY